MRVSAEGRENALCPEICGSRAITAHRTHDAGSRTSGPLGASVRVCHGVVVRARRGETWTRRAQARQAQAVNVSCNVNLVATSVRSATGWFLQSCAAEKSTSNKKSNFTENECSKRARLTHAPAGMRHDGTEEQVKMSQKSAKTWCLRLFPAFLFCISFLTYYCSYAILQSYGGANKSPNSSKSLCGSWLTQKKWESLNFNISRQTRLFLKLDDFFWKEHLSKLALPYGIRGSEQMLMKVLAATASFPEPSNVENLECRTCVVIGNSFSIKNTSLGSAINKYDIVFRLNDAPVRGYEEDVGNKTSMRLFYPESASVNPTLHNDPGTLMVLVPFKLQDLRWLKEILYDEKRVRKGFWKPPPQIWLGDPSKIRVLDPHFLHQTAERLLHIPLQSSRQNPVHPTTGILAVFVALNYCDVVHIAGFGYPSSKNQKLPIHYYGYDTMRSMKNSYHDLNHEAKALKRLEDAGAILYLHSHL